MQSRKSFGSGKLVHIPGVRNARVRKNCLLSELVFHQRGQTLSGSRANQLPVAAVVRCNLAAAASA